MWSGLLTSDHLYALPWYCLSSDHLFATCIVLRLSDQDFWSSLCNVNCLGIVGSGFQSSKSFYLTFSSPLHHQWKFLATLSSLLRYMYIQEVQCQLRRRQPAQWSQHIFARLSSFWLSLFTVSLRAWLLVCFSIMLLLLFLILFLVLFLRCPGHPSCFHSHPFWRDGCRWEYLWEHCGHLRAWYHRPLCNFYWESTRDH